MPASIDTKRPNGRPGDDDRLARLAARSAARRSQGSQPSPGPADPLGPGSRWPPPSATPSRPAARPPATPSRPAARPPVAPTRRTSRAHAARGSRLAALAMSVATTVGLAAWFHGAAQPVAVLTAATGTVSATTAAAPSGTPATGASSSGTTPPAATAAGPADGTFTGSTSSNRWGPVQVAITVAGGQIADVQVLQTPSDNGRSVGINGEAVPVLVSETLTAQSAKVSTVSGATYTSKSYRTSLQSAIDAATAAHA